MFVKKNSNKYIQKNFTDELNNLKQEEKKLKLTNSETFFNFDI